MRKKGEEHQEIYNYDSMRNDNNSTLFSKNNYKVIIDSTENSSVIFFPFASRMIHE